MSSGPAGHTAGDALRLRFLSYNMLVGMAMRHYGHYLTGAWRHALPYRGARANLDRIADMLQGYDFVAIQELDGGSLRTALRNQLEYLARRAGYPHFGFAVTRDLRPFAHHGLGFLSRYKPLQIVEHALPGPIPGRGAISVSLDTSAGGLEVMVTHLSLGAGTRARQLDFLAARTPAGRHAVLIGDLNSGPEALREHEGLRQRGFWVPDAVPPTFPSWRPQRAIDHVLLTRELRLDRLEAVPHVMSDHLPLAADITMHRKPATERS